MLGGVKVLHIFFISKCWILENIHHLNKLHVHASCFICIGRTQDVTESVRKLAYRILAEKVNIKSFTIAQRVELLSNGLHDRSESIKDVCAKELLGGWLKGFDRDFVKLLKCLDVEGCTEVAELALKTVLKGIH